MNLNNIVIINGKPYIPIGQQYDGYTIVSYHMLLESFSFFLGESLSFKKIDIDIHAHNF